MSTKFNQECLQAHNFYRAKHGSPPLVLSEKICKYSQSWAQTLASRDSGRYGSWNLAHSNCFANGYGENCAGALKDHSGKKPVEMFYNEIRVHNFRNNSFHHPSGHFTQVVWKSSLQLGVGRAVARSGNVYVVCNYYPPGNFQGKFHTNVLPLGTKPPAQPAPAPKVNQPVKQAKPVKQPEPEEESESESESKPAQSKPEPIEVPQPVKSSQLEAVNQSDLAKPSKSSDASFEDSFLTMPSMHAMHANFFDSPHAGFSTGTFSGALENLSDQMKRDFHVSTSHHSTSQSSQYQAFFHEERNFVSYKQSGASKANSSKDTD